MKLFLCVLALGLPGQFLFLEKLSVADDAKEKNTNGFYVQPSDANVDLSKFNLKSATILPAPTPEVEKSHLPSIEKRDAIFAKSGLTDSIKSLDVFDRDSLYINLRTHDDDSISRVIKKYPVLKGHEKELKNAENLIAEGKSK